METPEISLYKLISRTRPVEAYALLKEYGEAPRQKTYEGVEEGLRRIVRSHKNDALRKITAIHPHRNLFEFFPETLQLPATQEETVRKPNEMPEQQSPPKPVAPVENKPPEKENFFNPTNIAVISLASLVAIIAVVAFVKK